MTSGTAEQTIRLAVTPSRAPLDAEITVRVLNARPGGLVTVSAHSIDAAGQAWKSSAAFIADQSGTVDLRRDGPLPGSSYADIDAMGLVWSMRQVGVPIPDAAGGRLAPHRLLIVAQAEGSGQVTAEVWRQFVPDGLTRTEVRERGLVGVLYRPDDNRSLPAVQGICQDVETGSLLEILRTPVANWTYQGRELPYLPNVVTPRMEAGVAAGGPVSLGWAAPDLSRADQVAEAAIAVERIAGPVLLISGADDQTYGPDFQEAAAQRLAAAGHAYPFRHIVHEEAGHLIAAAGYRPTTQSVFPGPGVPFQYGGTPAADAAARLATWRETLRFLDEALH